MKRRWIFMVIGIIFFVGFLKAEPISAEQSESKEVQAKVATFNMQAGSGVDGKYDLDRIADTLSGIDADIIGLQEVDVHWGSRSNNEDTIRILAEKLHMHAYFAPIYDFDPEMDGAPRRQFGVGILSKHPIVQAENHEIMRLSTQNTEPIPEPAPGFLQADIDIDGAIVSFFVTHLDYRPDPYVRIMQISDMLRIMSASNYSVLMGDMNANPDAKELSPLFEKFQDVWEIQGDDPGYTYPSNNPSKRIDYIFASKRMQVNTSKTIDTGASDHKPVAAEMTLVSGNRSLTIDGMQMLVKSFVERGDIKNDATARRLGLHLSTIQYYKNQDLEDKALKHLRSFQTLLQALRRNQTISAEVYDVLHGDADYLLDRWQADE